MKRSVITVIGILALLIPASASAAKKYAGDLEGGGRMSFKLVRDNHGHKVVRQFRWSNMRISCNDGNHTYDATFIPMGVYRRVKFEAIATSTNPPVRGYVRGEVHKRKADGWIHVGGRIRHDDGVSSGCSSEYHVDWHAKRVF